jgi:hypothetical protein
MTQPWTHRTRPPLCLVGSGAGAVLERSLCMANS